jgi:hypothetical protein
MSYKLIAAIQLIMLGAFMTNVIMTNVEAPLKVEFVNCAKNVKQKKLKLTFFETVAKYIECKTIELGVNHKFCFFLNSVVLDEAKGLVKSDDAGNRLGVYK